MTRRRGIEGTQRLIALVHVLQLHEKWTIWYCMLWLVRNQDDCKVRGTRVSHPPNATKSRHVLVGAWFVTSGSKSTPEKSWLEDTFYIVCTNVSKGRDRTELGKEKWRETSLSPLTSKRPVGKAKDGSQSNETKFPDPWGAKKVKRGHDSIQCSPLEPISSERRSSDASDSECTSYWLRRWVLLEWRNYVAKRKRRRKEEKRKEVQGGEDRTVI